MHFWDIRSLHDYPIFLEPRLEASGRTPPSPTKFATVYLLSHDFKIKLKGDHNSTIEFKGDY